MSKAKTFLIIGVWVMILSFLGFPIAIKNVLFIITGLLIIYISYKMYLESKKDKKEEKVDTFSENKGFIKEEF